MLNIIRISDEALKNYWELLDWYASINVNLVFKFSNEYHATLIRIQQNPTHYLLVAPNIRRCLFPKMSCMILYKFENNIITVLVLKDTRSKPDENFY